MSTHKTIDFLCVAIIIAALLITILFMNGEALGISVMTDEESASSFTDNDLNGEWDTTGATLITLSGDTACISGNGAYCDGNKIKIVYAGKYMITGSLENGSIEIDADGDDKIWLQLDGVTIRNSDGAAVCIKQADKVFLTLAPGSENCVYSASSGSDPAIDGAIYSRDDLTINGSGTLTVTSAYKHGIVCNDSLVITGGSIAVSAKQDGIHAHDAVKIRDADIDISAGDDAIHAGNDEETSVFLMESGTVSVTQCYEGIEANKVSILGGTVNIISSDDGINASGSAGADPEINISGGDITLLNPNGRDADGLDSNGSIYITGGRLLISVVGTGTNSAIDYGSENGGELLIDGGTVIACGGSGMIESVSLDSKQGFLMYSVNGSAGSTLSLSDAAGKLLASEAIPYSFSFVTISVPGMMAGERCTLMVGDASYDATLSTSYGLSGFGMMRDRPGGEKPGAFGDPFIREDRGEAPPKNGSFGSPADSREPPNRPDGDFMPEERQ